MIGINLMKQVHVTRVILFLTDFIQTVMVMVILKTEKDIIRLH